MPIPANFIHAGVQPNIGLGFNRGIPNRQFVPLRPQLQQVRNVPINIQPQRQNNNRHNNQWNNNQWNNKQWNNKQWNNKQWNNNQWNNNQWNNNQWNNNQWNNNQWNNKQWHNNQWNNNQWNNNQWNNNQWNNDWNKPQLNNNWQRDQRNNDWNNFANQLFDVRNTIPLNQKTARQFQDAFKAQKNGNRLKLNAQGFYEIPGVNTKKVFFANPNNHKVLFQGKEVMNGPRGGFKKMKYGLNQQFVGFVPGNLQAQRNFNGQDNSDLTKLNLKAVIQNTVVKSGLMLARNAGTPLSKQYVGVNAFQAAAQDLKTLHQNRIYLRDIKSDNMAFDSAKNQVNLIDVDDRVIAKYDKLYGMNVYTPGYMTEQLRYAISNARNPATQRNYFRTADEYAFLVSVIETTDRGLAAQIAQAFNKNAAGVIDNRNRGRFQQWIRNNIQPTYHKDVENLLEDPYKFSVRSPDHAYLSNMMKFRW